MGTQPREAVPPAPEVPRAGMRRFVVEVAAFLTLTLMIPLASEVVLRVLNVRTEAAVFEPARGADGTPVMRLAWNPQFAKPQPPQPYREFLAHKPAGTFRIFVIGESEAEGSPYGTPVAFAAWLAKRLVAQAPDVRWEVVNAALGGLQSWTALAMVRDIARQQPDLLVVYLGHNETGAHFSPNERRWMDPRGFAWRAWLTNTRLYGLLSRILPARAASKLINLQNIRRMGNVNESEGGRRVYATPADRSLSAAMFRAHLDDMVRVMRTAGARTMLLTLSQNFSNWPPAISSHRPGLRPDEKAAWRAAVKAGDALAPHDCQGALAAWSRALLIDDTFAHLQFKVATCEWSLGREDDARQRFRQASDLDRLPQGAPTSLNDIVREVAREDGAILVDIDLAFTQASGPRLVGDDLFVDAEHLRILGHQLIAKAVADAIRESGVAGRQVRWDVDAYIDPDPATLLDANPEMRSMEKAAWRLSCAAAGRQDCLQ
jgi:lysophospholipase L1-like esterase